MPASLRIEELGGGVRCLKFSNPDRKHALDAGLLRHLSEAVTAPDAAQVRCWLIRSEGDGLFSSGYDVSALDSVGDNALPDDLLGDVLDQLQRLPAPSVALLTGPAFGAGCELACACDFRVGDKNAAFCLPPAKLGVVYAPRGVRRVAALTGFARAKWMLLTGRKVEADEAKLYGLLDVLTPVDDAEDEALELTKQLASNAPLAMRGMKRVFAALERGGPTAEETKEIDGLRRAAFNSQDILEGRLAFLEKRRPNFSGR